MADELIGTEREKYQRVYGDAGPAYRAKSHGMMLWTNHPEIFPPRFQTVLDVGCGQGRLMAHFNDLGKDAWGVDIAASALEGSVQKKWGHKFLTQCLWKLDITPPDGRARFDLGICTDVMEHIPEERVTGTLERIAAHCQICIFKIANFPSRSLGQDLHPTMRPLIWWMERFEEGRGEVDVLPIATPKEEYHLKWRPE